MTVKIPGRPKGKARPRFANGHAYTPKVTRDYEKEIAVCYKDQDGRKYEGDISIEITAVFKIPESWSKKKKWQTINEGARPKVRPDIDNIVKVVMDALNGVAYEDDSQVVEVKAVKAYGLGREEILLEVEGLDG